MVVYITLGSFKLNSLAVAVGTHLTKKLFCLFICSGNTYPLVIAAHPHEPYQIAVGLTDGGVYVIKPKEKSDNGAAS